MRAMTDPRGIHWIIVNGGGLLRCDINAHAIGIAHHIVCEVGVLPVDTRIDHGHHGRVGQGSVVLMPPPAL